MARLIEKRLKEKVAPLEDNEMRMLRENVRQPYLLSAVLKTNDQLVAARKATEAIVTPDPRPLADLTDGEEIFRKIVEPYRGRFIYLDVWGTWCAPCKEMMTHVPKMKQQLKDLNIVYHYLVNHSNEQAWKTAIAQFHLTGENNIHYNLPEKQQSALELYIGVAGYPTYKIVAPQRQPTANRSSPSRPSRSHPAHNRRGGQQPIALRCPAGSTKTLHCYMLHVTIRWFHMSHSTHYANRAHRYGAPCLCYWREKVILAMMSPRGS